MTRRCELCGSERCHVLFEGQDWLHGQRVQANVCQCDECGLIFLWPRPTRLLDGYPEEYAPHVGPDESADIAHSAGRRGGLMRKARLVSRYRGGALLDVGCAAGDFLAAVQGLENRRLLGTDLSDRAVRRARKRFGIQAWVGTVPTLPLPSASVGVITLWHVFEHLPDPVAALQDIGRVLEPGGIMILACPMADSWEARLFGRYWAGYDVPRHFYAYSRKTLPAMLHRAGFESSEVLHVVWSYNSAKLSSAFWLRRYPFFVRRPRLVRRTAAVMGAAVAVAFEGLSWIGGNRRSVAVVVARKRSNMEPR